MATKYKIILGDILYAVLIAIILLPGSDIKYIWAKVGIVFFAIAQRVWQHVNYYKLTKKIY